MNWHLILLIELSISDGLKIIIGPLFFVFALVLMVAVIWYRKRKAKYTNWEIVDVNLDLKSPISIKIKQNHDVVRVAYQVWMELQTRKSVLPFDEENDVILEVYNSWYTLFGIIRNQIKLIPAEHVRHNEDTAKLANLLVDVLNYGLRPHLTRWQARFRAWMVQNANQSLSPQEVQRQFPEYPELVADLKKVNHELIKFAATLRQLVCAD